MVGRYTVLAAATVASLSCGLNYCFSQAPVSLQPCRTSWIADLIESIDRMQCLCSSTRHSLAPHEYTAQHGRRSRQPRRLPLLYVQSSPPNTNFRLDADKALLSQLPVYTAPVIGRIVDKRGPKPTLVFAAIALTSGCQSFNSFSPFRIPPLLFFADGPFCKRWQNRSRHPRVLHDRRPGWTRSPDHSSERRRVVRHRRGAGTRSRATLDRNGCAFFTPAPLPFLLRLLKSTGKADPWCHAARPRAHTHTGSTAGLSSVGNSVAKSFRKVKLGLFPAPPR